MTGFKCDVCNWVGTDPTLHRELDKVDGGTAQYVVIQSCPECSCSELREVALCIDCFDNGAEVLATCDDYCRECAALNFDPEQMESFGG